MLIPRWSPTFTAFHILRPTNLSLSHRSSVYICSASGLLCIKFYDRYVDTLFVDLSLVGVRTLPYGFLAAFDPVSPTSHKLETVYLKLSYSQALTKAVRELLGKNKSRSEKVSTNAPIEFAENPQLVLPETASTTSRAETQSRSNMELTSLGERILIVVGENVNEDGEQGLGVGVEKMGQDLEESNVEFPMIERQL